MDTISSLLVAFDGTLEAFIFSLGQHGFFAVAVSVFLFGETAILIAFLLTQQDSLSLETAFVASVLGTLCADVFWFLVSRYFPSQFMPEWMRRSVLGPAHLFIKRMLKERVFIPMLLLRFFIGTRLIIIVYLARGTLSFMRFLVYDIIGTSVYIAFFASIGIGLGQIVLSLFPTQHILGSIAAAIVVVTCLWYGGRLILKRKGK